MKWTPLHHACHSGRLDVVAHLVEAGADVNAISLNGGTPITRAIESSAFDVVKYLLEKGGAKLRTETRKGKTPLELSHDWSDPNLISYLEEKFSKLPALKKTAKNQKAKKTPAKKIESPKVTTNQRSPKKNIGLDSSFKLTYNLERPASVLERMTFDNDAIFYSRNVWKKQMTTRDLIRQRVEQRERNGWEIDFDDFKMPFSKNISDKLININKT
ncbi:ankyrin repeat and EF-hand domain-containing protein 1-like [Octopus sinensis]|uniref:Ankyrin repeat and EF-hand domain-containing protein 1-like n=1 Tax=Octopus sinensis TaxID=2607531 RepID=A0A6P7TZR9_9MOLL|nr:ankyrin repeat and EF-hand domain-containing protein 1-like [Octopus sinensis]